MELTPTTSGVYLRRAFDQILAVADRVGEPGINERPLGPDTNAIAALVAHCCGMTEFWLGHVALGRANHRQREAEFTTTLALAEVHERVAATLAQALADVDALEAGSGIDEGGRVFLPESDATDASVVIHVIEELYQHLGHMELAADALAAR